MNDSVPTVGVSYELRRVPVLSVLSVFIRVHSWLSLFFDACLRHFVALTRLASSRFEVTLPKP
jgi:hypothetical protein